MNFVAEPNDSSNVELKPDVKSSLEKVSITPKSDSVNINNMSEKLRQVLERKTVIDQTPTVKEETKESDLPATPKVEPTDPIGTVTPKLEPFMEDFNASDVFNEVEITSEVEVTSEIEVSTTEEVATKQEPMETDDVKSMDSESTMDNETSNDAPAMHDSSSCDTNPLKLPVFAKSSRSSFNLFNDSSTKLISSALSDDNSQEDTEVGEEVDVVTSDKCEEDSVTRPSPLERIVKSDCDSRDSVSSEVVVTTTTTTTTTSTQKVTTVDGVIKSVRTLESVSSAQSKTIK